MQAKQTRMLEQLQRNHGNVSRAVKAVGISRTTHYRWLKDSPAYADQYNEVLEAIKDELEQALLERAQVSDTVLIFLAKTRLRDRGYNERDELTLKHQATEPVRISIDVGMPHELERLN